MEANGVFTCGRDTGRNGRFSFKSLLLDDEEVADEQGSGFLFPRESAAPFILPANLAAIRDPLEKHCGTYARESFKSLLLDDHADVFYQHGIPRGNGNHVPQSCVLSSSSTAVAGGPELVKDEPCRLAIENSRLERGDEEVEMPDNRPRLRKRRRANKDKAVKGQSALSTISSDPSDCQEFQDDEPQHPQDSAVQPAFGKNRKSECVKAFPTAKKRKQVGSSVEIEKFMDSLVARQEAFFAQLLQSMERKEAIRERIREEKEERWRAEERFQCGVFNNAMIALTKEITGDPAGRAEVQSERSGKPDESSSH